MCIRCLKMFRLILIFTFSVIYLFDRCGTSEDYTPARSNKIMNLDNFTITSDLVKDFLEHFKNPDANNLPLPIPDPFILPDRMYPMFTVKVTTTNVTARGISQVKIENFTSDIVEMTVYIGLRLKKLELIGHYLSRDWLQNEYSGGFNVTILNGYVKCTAKLDITAAGELSADEVEMDLLSRDQISINLENAGLLGAVMTFAGDTLFSAIKPYFFSLVSTNIRDTLNNGLARFKIMFPNSIAPLDLGVAEGRKFLKSKGFDPYYPADYTYATNIYSVEVTHIVVTGLSSVYRFGDVKIQMENNIVNLATSAETEVLEGSCRWEAGIGGILTRSGQASFTIEYVNIMLSVNQSLDIRKKPKIDDLKVSLGNLQLHVDGAGTLDYLAEVGVNVLPNVLRHQILQAAEVPIRRKVQEALYNTDIEALVLENLSLMDDQLYHRNLTKIEDNFVNEELINTIQSETFDEEAEF